APSGVSPQVWCDAGAITSKRSVVATGVGRFRLSVVPSPSWPESFRPQHQASPPAVRPQVWDPAELVSSTVNRAVPRTAVGTPRGAPPIMFPFPTWPKELSPQHHAAPEPSSAQECQSPARIEVKAVAPATGVGDGASVAEPFPSWPV